MSDSDKQEQAFLQRIKTTLDENEAQLDTNTLRDLRLARHTALESLRKPRRLWQPVAMATVAATVAVLVVALQVLQPKPATMQSGVEDVALLSANDDLELYENLDFYQWLELEQHKS